MSGDLALPTLWSWDQKLEESVAAFPPKFRAGTELSVIDNFRVYLCGQPNYNQWKTLLSAACFSSCEELYILDLRAECRLLVNGQYAVSHSLRYPVLDLCAAEEAFAEQLRKQRKLMLLSVIKSPKAVSVDGTQIERKITEELTELEIDSVYTEQQAISQIWLSDDKHKDKKLHYLRLPIKNHDVPSTEVIDQIISFMMFVYEKRHFILMHCEGGKGRSSLVLEMLKILYSYKFGVKPPDSIDPTSLVKIGKTHSGVDTEQGRVSPNVRSRSVFLEGFATYTIADFNAGKLWRSVQLSVQKTEDDANEVAETMSAGLLLH